MINRTIRTDFRSGGDVEILRLEAGVDSRVRMAHTHTQCIKGHNNIVPFNTLKFSSIIPSSAHILCR